MESDSPNIIAVIVALIVLLCLSAFFSASETAFTSANRIKLKNLAAKNKKDKASQKIIRRANLALKLIDSYDKLLSSVLIGNTVINVASSALATVLFVSLLGSTGITIATAVTTILLLIFGEISPKTIAKEYPEAGALRLAPFLQLFILLLKPFNYFVGAWRKVIMKLFPVKEDRSVTEDELLTFVGEVRQEGGINIQEEKMIRQVIEFDDITAAEICTPRINLDAVSENSAVDEIDMMFAETGYSRLPVYRENTDNITGVILLKDFHHEVIKKGRPPLEIIKPVVFASKTIKISGLLRTLQKKQSHMAVLVDEFGGTLGIVTIEDIIEELVGEIWDEHDDIVEEFTQNSDGSFSVLGAAKFLDMLKYINAHSGSVTDFSPDDEDLTGKAASKAAGKAAGRVAKTVANWVIENTGTMPRAGEHFVWRNLKVKVSKVYRHRVAEAEITVQGETGNG